MNAAVHRKDRACTTGRQMFWPPLQELIHHRQPALYNCKRLSVLDHYSRTDELPWSPLQLRRLLPLVLEGVVSQASRNSPGASNVPNPPLVQKPRIPHAA